MESEKDLEGEREREKERNRKRGRESERCLLDTREIKIGPDGEIQ